MKAELAWRQWLPDFVLLAMLWGSSFLFTREAALEFGPFATAFLRISLGAAAITPWLVWRGQLSWLPREWRRLTLSGAINSAIPFACYGYALLSISTGLSSILNACTPLFGTLIARLWLGTPLVPSRMVGLGLGFAGVVALVTGGQHLQWQASAPAILACLVATVCYGAAGCYSSKYLAHIPSAASATGSLWGATLLLAPLAWWSWPTQMPSMHAWLSVLVAGVLSTALAYVLYFRLLMLAGPTRSMTVTYLIPVFANALGVIVLDEQITAWMLGCAGVILLGTALASGLIGRTRAAR